MDYAIERPGAIDVFVSYAREDRPLMTKVVAALEAEGFAVGADADIERNANFGDAIDQMIRGARLTITLWTEKSAYSEWVRNESRMAVELEEKGFPNKWLGILVEDAAKTALPPDLRYKQKLELIPDGGLTDEGVARLVAEVSDILKTESRLDEEKIVFETARSLDRPEAWQHYLDRYPDGSYADAARSELERSKSEQPAAPPRTPRTGLWVGAAGLLAAIAALLFPLIEPQPSSGIAEADYIAAIEDRDALEQALTDAQTEAQTALTRAETEAERLRALLAEAETALGNAETEAANNGQQVEGLNLQISNLRAQIQDLQDLLGQAEEAEAEAERQIEGLDAELIEVRTRAMEAEAALETARAEGQDAQTAVTRAETEAERLRGLLADAQTALGDAETAAASNRQELEGLVLLIADLQPQIHELQGLLDQAEVAEAEAERQITGLTAEIIEVRTRALEADAALETAEAARQAAATRAAAETERLRNLLADAQTAAASNGQELEGLNLQISALQSQIQELQNLLDQASAAETEANIQIENLGSNLNAALARAAQAERDRAEAERREAELEATMAANLADQAEAASITYRVRWEVSDGVQNVRLGPGTMHRVTIEIPAGFGDLSLSSCRAADPGGGQYLWCRVSLNGQFLGWSSSNGFERE